MRARHSMLRGRRREYYGGFLMFATGMFAAVCGARYGFGSLTQMGSGFFPVCLGVILMIIGIAIALTAGLSGEPPERRWNAPDWRVWLCIGAAIVSFVLLGKYGGLLPATFAVVFISAFADRHNTARAALMLAMSLVLIAAVVFWWGLQLQFPLFSWG